MSKRQGGRCHTGVPAEAAASLAEPLELSNWASPTSQKEKDEVAIIGEQIRILDPKGRTRLKGTNEADSDASH